jgi:hypothetical protein
MRQRSAICEHPCWNRREPTPHYPAKHCNDPLTSQHIWAAWFGAAGRVCRGLFVGRLLAECRGQRANLRVRSFVQPSLSPVRSG